MAMIVMEVINLAICLGFVSVCAVAGSVLVRHH
jgi:hypothetical protein